MCSLLFRSSDSIREQQTRAKELVKKYFGAIHGTPTSIINFFEPEQTEAKEKTVQADVPLNAVFIAFKMCSRLHPDYYVADVTSDILSNGPFSRLHQRLVKEAKAFVEIDAYITASDDIGMFVIEGKVAENTDVQAAINLIWKELLLIQQELVNEQELQKCKNKMLTSMHFSESSLLNRAISLAYYESLGNANLINEEDKNGLGKSLQYMNLQEGESLIGKKIDYVFIGSCTNSRIEDLKKIHPSIGDWRNTGLLGCLELVKNRTTKEPMAPFNAKPDEMVVMNKVAAKIKELGMYTFVRWGYVFIAPPLCVTKEQIDEGLAIISEALKIADEAIEK